MRTFETPELVILDIDFSLGTDYPLELEVYTVALSRIPQAFLGREPLGVMRRPGVLWVDREEYLGLEDEMRRRMLEDWDYPLELKERFDSACRFAARAADAKTLSPKSLANVWEGLAQVMPYMAFNWALPREELAAQVSAQTGFDEEESRRWLVEVSTPERPPHFLRFRFAQLRLVRDYLEGREPAYGQFARRMGKLQNSLLARAELEDESGVAADTARLAAEFGSVAKVDEEETRLRQARQRALGRRRRALARALRATAVHGGSAERVESIAALARLASDEEEERHVLQMRSLTVLRLAAEQQGLPLDSCTSVSLGLPQLVEHRPRVVG